MSGKVNWITYQGKQILYGDYRGLREKEIMEVYNEAERIFSRWPEPVLMIGDFRDAYLGPDFMKMVKAKGKLHVQKAAKVALLGIGGLKSILFDAYMRIWGDVMAERIKSFETEEAAKEWLVR
jgi:hypothetical protein